MPSEWMNLRPLRISLKIIKICLILFARTAFESSDSNVPFVDCILIMISFNVICCSCISWAKVLRHSSMSMMYISWSSNGSVACGSIFRSCWNTFTRNFPLSREHSFSNALISFWTSCSVICPVFRITFLATTDQWECRTDRTDEAFLDSLRPVLSQIASHLVVITEFDIGTRLIDKTWATLPEFLDVGCSFCQLP